MFVIKVNGVYPKAPVNEALQKLQMNDELNKNVQSTLSASFQELKNTADIKDYAAGSSKIKINLKATLQKVAFFLKARQRANMDFVTLHK